MIADVCTTWLCIASTLGLACSPMRPLPASPLESDEESEAISEEETDEALAMSDPHAIKLPKLPPRGAAFVRATIAGVEPAEAAKEAGFRKDVAAEAGKRLLVHPAVRAHVRAARLAEADDTALLLELARIALLDPIDLFDENGKLRRIHEMPERARRAIASFEVDVDEDGNETRKVKFWDKPASIRLLGQSRGMFAEKLQHELSKPLEQLIEEALKKPKAE